MRSSAPQAELNESDAPQAELRESDAPHAELRESLAPQAELRESDAPQAENAAFVLVQVAKRSSAMASFFLSCANLFRA